MTYEYKCYECGHNFNMDKLIGTAINPETCPRCGGQGFRVYNPTPVHFKGEGFTCACAEGCEDCRGAG